MQEGQNSQTENSSNNPVDPAYRYIKVGFFVSVLILLGSWIMFVWNVGGSLSSDSSNWSDFGGFLGGVGSAIGPIFTVAGLLFVWWQSKEASKQQQRQLNNLKEQLQYERETLFDARFRSSIDRIDRELSRILFPSTNLSEERQAYYDEKLDSESVRYFLIKGIKQAPTDRDYLNYWPYIGNAVSESYYAFNLILRFENVVKNSDDPSKQVDIRSYYDVWYAAIESADGLKGILNDLTQYDEFCKYPELKGYEF